MIGRKVLRRFLNTNIRYFEGTLVIVHHLIRKIIVPNADGTARLAAADADEWAGDDQDLTGFHRSLAVRVSCPRMGHGRLRSR